MSPFFLGWLAGIGTFVGLIVLFYLTALVLFLSGKVSFLK